MRRIILINLVLLLVAAGMANGRTIMVRLDGTGDYTTIQDAINDSNDGDIIGVADGTYTGPGNRDIYFLGKAITVRSESGPENCIIDCKGTQEGYHYGFYFYSGEDANSVLDGFTVTNAFAYGRGRGAIACRESSPTITNCIVSRNAGRAIYCGWSSSPTITNCTMSGNLAEGHVCSGAGGGGGICCHGGSPTIDNCIIINNSVLGYSGDGGGIYCRAAHPTITDCIISGNRAGYGGGIYCESGSLTITNCRISGNTANEGGNGGGICCRGSNTTITNCRISGNTAEGTDKGGYGGGICCGGSNTTITNCTISGNTAKGIDEDCYGGGIYYTNPLTSIITNCTFTENSAVNGSAIACDSYKPSNVQLTNCILADGGNEIWNNDDSTITITYSDVQGSWPGQGNIDQDPCFAFSTDYHVMPDSPCIDAGDPNYIPEPNETDLDGQPRIISGRVDMGAYEYTPNRPSIATSATLVSMVSFYFVESYSKPDPQTLLIRNCGTGTLHWEIVADCNWLEVAPANGVSTGQIDQFTLTADTNSLSAGYYVCNLTVFDPNAANSPAMVSVILHIAALLRVPQHFPTIRSATHAANTYDVVLVADGTYTGFGNRGIYFSSWPCTVKSENGPEKCIIDCQGSDRAFDFHKYTDKNSILEGFTITNGQPGIRCEEDSSPTITNCIISNNTGRGITCWRDSSPTINNCTINNNAGDGIASDGSPTINNCTISENGVVGIYHWVGNLTITDSTINNNNRGGIYGGRGESLFEITNCTINNNIGGGIFCERRSNLTITNSTITGNSTGGEYDRGGGIRCEVGTIINCIISGNSAAVGGGILCNSATIINCTITGNSTEGENAYGGGIFCTGGWYGSGTLTLSNCILWGNEAPNGPQIYLAEDSNALVNYTDVQGDQNDIYIGPDCTLDWGQGNIDADPCFVEAGYWADANDPNIIVEPNDPNAVWIDGDYHLFEVSPCIDAGDPNYVPEPNETDLDGNPRVIGDYIDMGAYEFNPPVEAEMKLTPQMVNCSSKGKWIKAQFVLPEGFPSEDVDVNEPAVAEPMGAESEYIRVFGSDDGPVKLEVAFDRQAFCALLTDEDSLEITVIGSLTTGQYFYGTDTIKIKSRR